MPSAIIYVKPVLFPFLLDYKLQEGRVCIYLAHSIRTLHSRACAVCLVIIIIIYLLSITGTIT